jgi:hypothetical protein
LEKNRRKFPWLPVAGMAVLACALGLFWLSQNPTSVAQWALKKAMPQAGIAVDAVRFGEPGEIIFENFVLPDPLTGKPLLRLERGRLVFTFSDILRRRIGEIHLVNPLLVISPGWSGVFPKTAAESKSAPAPTIRRIFCDFGEVLYEGSSTGRPDISAKFCMDWKEIGVHSEGLQDFTLWDIQATSPGFQNPFLVLDLIRLRASPRELFERFEIRESKISGGALAIGSALDQLTHLPKNPAQNPTPTWRLGLLEISGVRASLGENAWRAESDITFTIATTLQNLTPSEITNKLGATEQSIELSNLAIPSPRDPFTHVLKLRSVLIQFTLAGLLEQEIRGVTLTSPVVSIGEDLFLYMDQARSRRGGGAATDSAAWKIQRLEVKSGSLVIGSGGRDNYGLPLNFQTVAENVALNDLASLTLSGSLEIPARNYQFPDYQITFETKPGDLRFSYPPEKAISNVVGTVKIKSLRWRQYLATDAWISATFDREGINSTFGGVLYGGNISGGFGFFFSEKSPWIGWLGGKDVDLKKLTDVIAPQNFSMTGPLEFSVQTNAEAKSIQRVQGSFRTTQPGTMEIGKLDDLLAKIPQRWSALKRDSLRIALESLRNFDYRTSEGSLWFTDGQGILDLKLQGPQGSRTFQTLLHADESPEGQWKQKPARP